MPSLQQLRYLVAISETLHFRRAAEMVHVTQPTLSGQLRDMEERLGVQLVERSRSRVLLTPTGEAIAARARIVLRDMQEIAALAERGRQPLGGTIRVGVLASIGPYLLPHILPDLHRTYPDLRFYIREGVPESLLNGLEGGALDLLLSPLPIGGQDTQTARLYREPLYVVVPGDHRLGSKKDLTHNDLKGETVLTLERGHRLYDQVRDLCQEFGAELSLDYEGTSLDTLRQMVAVGMGVTFLPSLYVGSEVRQDDQLVTLQMRRRGPSRTVGMAWRRQSARADEFETLAADIRRFLKGRGAGITVVN